MFGLFGKPKWQKEQQRAARAFALSDWAKAREHLRVAIDGAPEDEKPALEAQRIECENNLCEIHLVAAAEYENIKDFENASDRWELILKLSPKPRQREQAREKLRALDAAMLAGDEPEEDEDELAIPKDEADEINAFNLRIGQLPDRIADQYESMGRKFRGAFLDMHEAKFQRALDYFTPAAAEKPDSLPIQFEMGRTWRALRDNDKAIEAFTKAEQLAGDWNFVRLALAEVAWAEKKWDLAEEVLQRALDHDDSDVQVYLAVAETALRTEQPDYGIEAAEVVLADLAPGHRGMLIIKAQLHEMRGESSIAIDALEDVVQRSWQYDSIEDKLHFDEESTALLAAIYSRSDEKLPRAEELLRALVGITPREHRWVRQFALCDILIRLKDDEADKLIEQLSRRVPDRFKLARLMVAKWADDSETTAKLLDSLSDKEREAWDKGDVQIPVLRRAG